MIKSVFERIIFWKFSWLLFLTVSSPTADEQPAEVPGDLLDLILGLDPEMLPPGVHAPEALAPGVVARIIQTMRSERVRIEGPDIEL